MKISTTEEIPGYEVIASSGLVMGNTVQSKHIGRDIMAGLKTIVGGEVKGYTEMLTDAREIATQRMIDMASKLNANGVICVRFTTSSLGDGMSELLAYGTAVTLKKC